MIKNIFLDFQLSISIFSKFTMLLKNDLTKIKGGRGGGGIHKLLR